MASSLWTPLCLAILWILLSQIMERTGNCWYCVLGHAAYNGAQILAWPLVVIGLMRLFTYCSTRSDDAQDPAARADLG